MEQQKVFATALRGFDKKAVLDYIYEQDVLFKKKEAELTQRLEECESKLNEQQLQQEDEQSAELCQERIDALERTCSEQREAAALLQEKCERLRREADQYAQAARSKEGELQLQTELNRQLQQKCEILEGKLQTLAEHLLAEREASVTQIVNTDDGEDIADVVETQQEASAMEVPLLQEAEDDTAPKTEFTDLKGEIDEFRQSVSKTLLNFEAALARLEADKSDEIKLGEDSSFFR
ncbi:MAG: hypothetical protein RR528_06095 [Angelakisella sp.]